jgi:hypothetical protein
LQPLVFSEMAMKYMHKLSTSEKAALQSWEWGRGQP